MRLNRTNVTNETTIQLTYQLSENNWYLLASAPPAFNKLPKELKIEETAKPELINAPYIIKGRQVKGVKEFFTGLKPFGSNTLFYGNKPEFRKGKTIRRLLLFVLSEDSQTLSVYFTFKLYFHTKEVEGFMQTFFNKLKQPKNYNGEFDFR